jgi:hypothetical protein
MEGNNTENNKAKPEDTKPRFDALSFPKIGLFSGLTGEQINSIREKLNTPEYSLLLRDYDDTRDYLAIRFVASKVNRGLILSYLYHVIYKSKNSGSLQQEKALILEELVKQAKENKE